MKRTPWGRSARHEPLDHVELARLLPAPGDPALPPDRQLLLERHLMTHIQQRTGPSSPEYPAAPAGPAPRPVRRALLIAVPVTAAVVAAVVAVNTFGGAGAGGTGGGAGPENGQRVAAPVVQLEPGDTQPVSSVAEKVSRAAETQKFTAPRQDQYIYVKSKVSYLSIEENVDTNERRTMVQKLHPREVWLSPNGLKGWLYEPGFQPEDGISLDGDVEGWSYNKVSALPTDTKALLDRIYAYTDGDSSRDQQAFDTISDMISEQLAPPKISAALYRAGAKIPGVVVVDHAKDAAGRPGVALARTDEQTGERREWIFDKQTYAYLGSRGIQTKQFDDVKPGTVVERTAILTRKIVNKKKSHTPAP
ncbi:CU044_5270 family protein [Streptomyces luteocolor]|uniref:CU044_5270 family protein n=2 Tax=Streptomyces TaxID=1883 RepID=UPI0008530F96|nr:CU044_5270 family protein [Streptomyces luteocolor]